MPTGTRDLPSRNLALESERTRNVIVSTFLEQLDGTVSGEYLSQVTGISRTAVWKYIRHLEGMGFVFRAMPGSGYTLESTPDLLLEPLLRQLLPDEVELGKTVHWLHEVDSTNRLAMELAFDPLVEHGTLIAAGVQTGGRGRRGRPWFAPKEGLWQTMILKQPFPLRRAAELTLLASVALRRAIKQVAGVDVGIKWPNDLQVDGRKVSGILAEIRADGESVQQAVLGIGINTNITADAFPEPLRPVATSLLASTGKTVSHLDLSAALWTEFDPLYASLVRDSGGFSEVSQEWRAASVTLGRRIRVQVGERQFDGDAVELRDDGILLLRATDGVFHEIHSGEVLFELA